MSCSFKIGNVDIPVKDIFIYPQMGIHLTRTGFVDVVNKLKLPYQTFRRMDDRYPFVAEAWLGGHRIYTISDSPYYELGYHELAVQEK